MSWEAVEQWPTSVVEYRGSADELVASRAGISFAERARLWWHSTPQSPFADVAHDVALTERYVYTRNASGIRRAPRNGFEGVTVDAGRRIYPRKKGAPLVLPDRGGDALELRLDALAGTEPPWRGQERSGSKHVVVAFGVACYVAVHVGYSLGSVSEVPWVVLVFGALVALFGGAPRVFVDTGGVTRIRGFVGVVRSTTLRSEIRSVHVVRVRAGWRVVARVAHGGRRGIALMRRKADDPRPLGEPEALTNANELARRCARLLGVRAKLATENGR